MRVWILCTGEPVPFLPAEAGDRFLRAGKLAEFLNQQGHEVTWWTAQFDHYRKTFRDVPKNVSMRVSEAAPRMVFLGSCGYQRHMGPRRFLDHWQIGKAFRNLAPELPKPDVILASFPLVELCHEAVRFGKLNNTPVILDIRDLWPDIIYERIREKTGFSGEGLFLPYELLCKRSFQHADRVIGITKGMQSWCYDRFGRDIASRSIDTVFRQFKTKPDKTLLDAEELRSFWAEKGIDLSRNVTRLVWTGSIVGDSDGSALLEAIKLLPNGIENHLQIIVAGNGSLVPNVKATAAQCRCLKYVGWIRNAEMNMLLEHSHVGLLCYLDRFDFQIATPNKIIDYCAAGMRILTNLTGEVKQLSNDPEFVVNYQTGDSKELARILLLISNNPEKYRKKLASARDIFDAEFDADKILPNFQSYLIETVSEHKNL